jgi:hypothetical protein
MIVLARENIIGKIRKGAVLDDVSAVKKGVLDVGATNVWILSNQVAGSCSTS